MSVNRLRSLTDVPEHENIPQSDLPVLSLYNVNSNFKLLDTELLVSWHLKAQLTEEESEVCEGDGGRQSSSHPARLMLLYFVMLFSHCLFKLSPSVYML